jgi:hypothetical protein
VTEKLIELAKGAMLASATYHAEVERLRYEAWRKAPKVGKAKYEPEYDRQMLCQTFDDLFGSAVDAIRREAK